jgi:Ion channel
MLRQFLVGGAISAVNIIVHALVMAAVVWVAQTADAKQPTRPWLHLIAVMIATVSILMVAHACEVIVWSLSYAIVDAAPVGADRVYFAFVNYTTLGYGDVVPVARWRLLGPMTAMNGVLMFGWSTAVIFEVLRRTMTRIAPAAAARWAPSSPSGHSGR